MDIDREPRSHEKPFTSLDRHFADFMVRLSGPLQGDRERCLWLAAALVSNYVSRGHVCLSLGEGILSPPMMDNEGPTPDLQLPDRNEWLTMLRRATVVGKPGEFKPLILDERGRLYLYRYWLYEQQFTTALVTLGRSGAADIDRETLTRSLRRFFPDDPDGAINWQRIAALVAVYKRFCIISGGPGTGKTFTVARILALLAEQSRTTAPSIAMAAPTGKAAARLTGMIRQMKEELDCDPGVKALIPGEASTIHRLLGPVYGTRRFRFNETNPLPHDIVIVDEASMIDLPLMAKLVAALHKDSRLVLLGDKDQLASVEPGAVFGDLCDGGQVNVFSPDFVGTVRAATSIELPCRKGKKGLLDDSVVVLQKSYRFGPESGIGLLAAAVKAGEVREALALLKGASFSDVVWRGAPYQERFEGALKERLIHKYKAYFASRNVEQAFTDLNTFHILCALRVGPYGAIAVNRMIEDMCRKAGFLDRDGRWYTGRPVMVTENDYHLRLFNGDVGVAYPDDDAGGELRIHFPKEGGLFRKLHSSRLSAFETVYAMTVHKSQGSEFDHVLLMLPDSYSGVVTRELIYTALTRARKTVEIWGTEQVFAEALSQTTSRQSGLREALLADRRTTTGENPAAPLSDC